VYNNPHAIVNQQCRARSRQQAFVDDIAGCASSDGPRRPRRQTKAPDRLTYGSDDNDHALPPPKKKLNIKNTPKTNSAKSTTIKKQKKDDSHFRIARLPLPVSQDLISGLIGAPHSLGNIMTCPHCAARYWLEKRTTEGKFTVCCSDGGVRAVVPPLLEHPDLLEELLTVCSFIFFLTSCL
jgi:hypothetical protein